MINNLNRPERHTQVHATTAPSTPPVTRRRSAAPAQNSTQLRAPQRLTIRTALAAGATIATLIGAQNLLFLDKLNTIASTINTGSTGRSAKTGAAANAVSPTNVGQSPIVYSVAQTAPTATTIPSLAPVATTVAHVTAAGVAPKLIIVRNAANPGASGANVLVQPTATLLSTATDIPSATPFPTALPTIAPVQNYPVASAYVQPRPRTKSS